MFAPQTARKSAAHTPPQPKASLAQTMGRIAAPDSGRALDAATRAHFEPSFGASFADVRVHDSAAAAHQADALGARAYTLGNHIVFGAGAHAPNSQEGRATMAHELAHVAQQRGGAHDGTLRLGAPGSAAEREADGIAHLAARGAMVPFAISQRVSPGIIHRQHIHMSSGRFVGDMTGAENNQQDEVLDVIGKLLRIGAVTQAGFNTEQPAIKKAASPVPAATIPVTIAGITAAEDPQMAKDVAKKELSLSLTGPVGKGQANAKDDVSKMQGQLLKDWHLESAKYNTENGAVTALGAGAKVPDATIPETIAGIGKQKIAIVAGNIGKDYNNQLAGGVEMGKLKGTTATWTQSYPGSGSTFEKWASAASEQPLFALAQSTEINCWEMVLYAALKGGLTKWQFVHDIYTSNTGPGWDARLVMALSRGGRTPYVVGDANTPRPNYGQIVFFNGDAHVAMSNGAVNSAGKAEVWTFWPPPDIATTGNAANRYATIDKVKISTIEDLVPHIQAPAMVNFAKPPWK